MKSLKTEHCRLLNEAKEQTAKAAQNVSAVGLVKGISALISAVRRGGDAYEWEGDLSDALINAMKLLNEAEDEIDKAIEIVMENEGADDEDRS